jgi:prolyl oligopeptidase
VNHANNNSTSASRYQIAVSVIAAFIAGCAAPPSTDTPRTPESRPTAASTPSRASGPPVRPVTETFFGTSVTDNYRYMENTSDPEVASFMKSESAAARAALDAIPGRAALETRINQLSQANTSISAVQVAGTNAAPRIFYYKLAPGVNSRKLYARDGYKGAERVVFDPESISKPGQRFAIDYFLAAPDGRHVLVGVAAGGSEETTLRVIEVTASGTRDTGVSLDRIGFADESKWALDSKSFFYNQLPALTAADPKNRYLNSRAMRHILGRPAAQNELVFSRENAGVELADIDIPSVSLSDDGRILVGRVEHGDARELSLFTADAADIGKTIRWRRFVSPADEVTDFKNHGGLIYLQTKKSAPRYRIVRTLMTNPSFVTATVVVPQGDHVIAQMEVAQDALYVRELRGGVDYLQRLNFSTTTFSAGKLEFVRLPFDLAIRQLITSPSRGGAILRLESWTEAPKYVTIEERSGNVADTGLHPKSNVDFSDIVELRLAATAKDGTKIPVSLIYRKATQLNSFNPTLIRAYGAYGIVQSPSFNPSSLAWLERGGILATCHVRGGGEYGDAWHRGGQKTTKPNTWRDLIACSEYLIERGFTRSERLGIQGGSAGGITVGRALTERPDLFAAVVPSVGVLDALRAEFTPNGPPNIPEFGTVKTEEGFRGLLAMSSVHQVKDGTRYPAVMLTHGVNDPRVEVWHSAKMAARLKAATGSVANAKPVLLRLDYDAGHGVVSTRNQRNAELADVYSFLLWQFGEQGFQPGR